MSAETIKKREYSFERQYIAVRSVVYSYTSKKLQTKNRVHKMLLCEQNEVFLIEFEICVK